jgi:hypothetical protein
MELFGVQRRETAKQPQFLELMKAMFGCGGNERQRKASMRHHKRNSLEPREEDFLKVTAVFMFFQEMQHWNKLYCISLMADTADLSFKCMRYVLV